MVFYTIIYSLNQLELPEYETKEKLEKMMDLAIELGKEGFGFE